MKGIFGLFTYFSQLDRDGSGYLEKDEIEYLAEMFFGQGDKAKVQSYVNEVFDKFDYDHSGELSYEGLHLSGSYLTSRISLTSSALVVVQTTF